MYYLCLISRRYLISIVAICLTPIYLYAQTPTEWGASANGAYGDCTDDSCLTPLSFIIEEGNGSINVPSANYSLSNAQGSASSSVVIVGGLSVPQLTTLASSNSAAFQQGTATGIQGYTYDGPASGTISLTVNLTGNNTNPDADAMTGLAARVSLVRVDAGFLFTQASFVSLLYATAPFVEFEETASGVVNESQVVGVDLAPGDQFYIVAVASATATGAGAIADAANTLTMDFTVVNVGVDPDPFLSLTPAFVVSAHNVPAMSPVAVILLGLVMLLIVVGVPQKVLKVRTWVK